MKRRIAATAAALAVGAGVVGAAAVATPGPAKASASSGWNRIVQTRDSGSFQSIAAVSKSNVWVAGIRTQGSKTVYKPYLRHFNGSTWKAVTIPGAAMTSDRVQATSPGNVWVFGLVPNSRHIAASAAYRWDGARWHKIPVPAYTYLQGDVVLSPSNVWAFGGSQTLAGGVFHWNGSRWRTYSLNSAFVPQFMSASSAGNVWLSGMTWSGKTQKAAAYRWNGSRWLAVSMPHPVVTSGPGVTALSPSNVWIGWDTATTTKAAHWDGHQWHVITAPDSIVANSFQIVPDGRGGYWFGPFADWTGHAWVSAVGISPGYSAGAFNALARIPGTLTFLMAAGVMNTGSSTEHPTVYRLSLG